MALIEVTSTELRNKAEQLSELNSQFESRKNDLEAKELGLTTMWEGEAKRLFHEAFNNDKEQMNVFIALIRQYVAALLEIAQRYEETEARNAEIAASRSY